MRLFVFYFLELFSYMGCGTPEDPGGDFTLQCIIEAEDERAALEWGWAVLGDYRRARFQYSGPAQDGKPVRQGEIDKEADPSVLLRTDPAFPKCRVGEFPV